MRVHQGLNAGEGTDPVKPGPERVPSLRASLGKRRGYTTGESGEVCARRGKRVEMDTDGEICVATIERSKTSDIRVRLVEFGGRPFVDLRTFVVVDAVERVPTRKGIAIPPALLGEVIAALEKAAGEAVKGGGGRK